MRIALGEIVQETGTFTPALMGLEAFESYGLYQGNELLEQIPGVGPPGGFLQGLAERAEKAGEAEPVEVIPLARAWAGAGPRILDATYDRRASWTRWSCLCTERPASSGTMISRGRCWRRFAR